MSEEKAPLLEDPTLPEKRSEKEVDEDLDSPLRLSVVRKTVKVELVDESTGEVVAYNLKEMTGLMRDQWMNSMQTKMKTSADGKAQSVKDFTGLHALLIAKCLFTLDNKPVPDTVIQGLPSSTQNALFDRCQKMNGLTDKAADKAKKD